MESDQKTWKVTWNNRNGETKTERIGTVACPLYKDALNMLANRGEFDDLEATNEELAHQGEFIYRLGEKETPYLFEDFLFVSNGDIGFLL